MRWNTCLAEVSPMKRSSSAMSAMASWSGAERHSHAGTLSSGTRRDFSGRRSEEHTSELQSLMRISYAVFCLKKKNNNTVKLYYIHDLRITADYNKIDYQEKLKT